MLVRDLPKDYVNPDHYDFLHDGLIGPEFNSTRAFKEAIKGRVAVRPGE